jgi:hypothetical protein
MPAATTEDRLVELAIELDRWTREQIASRGLYYRKDAKRHIAKFSGNSAGMINDSLFEKVLARLGDSVSLGHRGGYSRTSAVVRPQSLATLHALAEECTVRDGTFQPEAGEKATREVRELTSAQLATVRAAAAFTAAMVMGGTGRLEDVGMEHFSWDPVAGKAGRGEWTLVAKVAEFSDLTARVKHEKRRPNVPFRRESNAARREKHTTGIRKLLDLGATFGRLSLGDNAKSIVMVHDAAWHPVLTGWDLAITEGRNTTTARAIRRGVRTLALYATRRGWRTPEVVDWARIRESISADYQDGKGSLRYQVFTWSRYAFNALVEAGLVDSARWALPGDARVSLVKKALVRRAARDGTFAWTTLDGRPARALVAGTFGLTGWWRWVRFESSEAVLADGLPPRCYPNPTEREKLKVARSRGKAFRLDTATVDGRISDFAWHGGFCARELGIDWHSAGADELCDPAHLRAHGAYRDRAAGKAVGSSDSLVSKAAFGLATLASPYLEARALQQAARALRLAQSARMLGQQNRADQLESHAHALSARATQLKDWSGELKALGLERMLPKQHRRDGDEITRREVQELWLLWSADGVSGWHKIRQLRDEIALSAEREFARCLFTRDARGRLVRQREMESVSISDQIALIERERDLPPAQRTFIPSQAWAVLVRDTVVVGLMHRIPLRERNLAGMTFENWRATTPGKAIAAPWEGEIHLHFQAAEMKTDHSFQPSYLLAADRLHQETIDSARPDLLKLYFMLGGARGEILRLNAGATPVTIDGTLHGPGDIVPSRFIFPALARKPGRSDNAPLRLVAGSRWDEGSFASHWRRLIFRYSKTLNVDFTKLAAVFGGTAPHCCRHLAGTHHVQTERYEDAIGLAEIAVLLGHRDTTVTQARYVGVTERQISVTRPRIAAPTAPALITPADAVASPSASYSVELGALLAAKARGDLVVEEFLHAKADLARRYGLAAA